jgi:hypothetical protein
MYSYSICNMPTEDIFYKQCKAIESKVPITKKRDLLTDVDGSLIQKYSVDGGEIRVDNDRQVGCVYVTSDIELTQFFK